LLAARGISFEEIKVDWDDEAAWQEMSKRTGLKTVPQIFFDQVCIGGYTELAAIDAKGDLQAALA
jgi:glutaredoxin 3